VLDEDFDPAVFDVDFVGFEGGGGATEALAGLEVEAPAVPVALDGGAAEVAVGEGRAAMGAEVFDGVEAAFRVVEREFGAVFEFDGGAAPFGYVFDATDGDERAGARGAFGVLIPGIEGLHLRVRA
jgi:hypothetical protein